MIAIKEYLNNGLVKWTVKEGNRIYGRIYLNRDGKYQCFVRLKPYNLLHSFVPYFDSALREIFSKHNKDYVLTPIRLKGVKYPKN